MIGIGVLKSSQPLRVNDMFISVEPSLSMKFEFQAE